MRAEQFFERQGKKIPLYGALLNAAHQLGLKSIDTEPLQIPTEANNNVSITKATVELEDGRKFSGIGDASPQNVGKMIKDHIIRMSETRAKSRALRDAVNVGELIVDESEIDADEAREQIASLRGGASAAARAAARAAKPSNNGRKELRRELYDLMKLSDSEEMKQKKDYQATLDSRKEWLRSQDTEALQMNIDALKENGVLT